MRLEAVVGQFGGERFALGNRARVDEHLADRADGGMGADEMGAKRAGTDQRHHLGVLAREIIGSECGGCGRAAPCDLAAIHHGHRLAGLLINEEIAGLDGGQALRRIVGLEHHGLEAGPVLRPCGHQQ